MGIKCILTHGEVADIAIEVASMNFKKRHLIVVASVIVSILFVIIFILGLILKVDSASTGLAHSYIKTIGRAIAYSLKESNSFPRDDGSADINHQPGQFNQWYSLFDVDKLLSDSGRRIDKDIPKAYFDLSIWTVAKNIPDDPPPNLIVLATRNVDPASLRTKLTDEDMQKHIQFRGESGHLMILRKYAIVLFADGTCTSIPVVSPTSRRGNRTTYKFIYRNRPFDLTTNLVNGLQVKYLTPDDEIIPVND
jgi:hypothetical protein